MHLVEKEVSEEVDHYTRLGKEMKTRIAKWAVIFINSGRGEETHLESKSIKPKNDIQTTELKR